MWHFWTGKERFHVSAPSDSSVARARLMLPAALSIHTHGSSKRLSGRTTLTEHHANGIGIMVEQVAALRETRQLAAASAGLDVHTEQAL